MSARARPARPDRFAFTLIELLVVMAIISVLAALLLAGVQSVRKAGDRAKAKAEINQLTLALASFKADRGGNPLLSGGGPGGEFRLCTSYLDPTGTPLAWPEVDYLRQSWPQINLADTGLRNAGAKVLPAAPVLLDGNQAAILWLCGGQFCNYLGLSNSPTQPFLVPNGGDPRKRYLEPNSDRLRDPVTGTEDGRFRDPWGTPYAILASGAKVYAAGVTCYGVSPYSTMFRGQLNAGGTQILSAGRDKQFGPGGNYTAGSGAWTEGQPGGGDDLSNFRTLHLGAPDGD